MVCRFKPHRYLVAVLYAASLFFGAKVLLSSSLFGDSSIAAGRVSSHHSELYHQPANNKPPQEFAPPQKRDAPPRIRPPIEPPVQMDKTVDDNDENEETADEAESVAMEPPRTTEEAAPEPIDIADRSSPAQLINIPSIPGYPIKKGQNFVSPRRVVHFDLKGGPMKPDYFPKIFPILKKLGATGILLEWEDMFPYRGRLKSTKNGFAYTMDEVKSILQAAKDSQLDVIPLVQTFGHLEWVLKLPQFAHLRENPKYPQVMCVGSPEAWELIREAIVEVATAHASVSPIPFFHIGADEAFQVGHCQKDAQLMRIHGGKQGFILWHIARTARFIQNRFGSHVLAWHDMFANSGRAALAKFAMLKLVEPVNWNYAENLDHYMPASIWNGLSAFPSVWGASAFKGADGPGRFYSNIPHYHTNHRSWQTQMNRHSHKFKEFRGIILTGWSRYDHLSVLCELFPVGFPSLAVNLITLNNGGDYNQAEAAEVLKCQLHQGSQRATGCQYPGSRVYELIQELNDAQRHLHSGLYQEHEFQGWMGRTAVRFNVSSAWYLDRVLPKVQREQSTFQRIRTELRLEMNKIFYPDTAEEFLHNYLDKDLDELNAMVQAGQAVMGSRTFRKRPYKEFVDSARAPPSNR